MAAYVCYKSIGTLEVGRFTKPIYVGRSSRFGTPTKIVFLLACVWWGWNVPKQWAYRRKCQSNFISMTRPMRLRAINLFPSENVFYDRHCSGVIQDREGVNISYPMLWCATVSDAHLTYLWSRGGATCHLVSHSAQVESTLLKRLSCQVVD